jgi:hypothetical protein
LDPQSQNPGKVKVENPLKKQLEEAFIQSYSGQTFAKFDRPTSSLLEVLWRLF